MRSYRRCLSRSPAYHLQTPWDSEDGGAVGGWCASTNEGSTVRDVVEDENTCQKEQFKSAYVQQCSYIDEFLSRSMGKIRSKLTPGDSPLLEGDETPAFRWRRDLRDVDWNLGGFDTNAKSVDDTANNEHTNILRCANNGRADDPEYAANHDRLLPSEDV